MKLRDIAERLGCRLEGDGDIEIQRVAGIEYAQPGDLTFFANPRYSARLRTTRASAVIAGEDAPAPPCAVVRSPHPYLTFARAVSLFDTAPRPTPGIDARAAIADDASLGPDVSVGPFVSVGSGARVGARTVIYPNVTIGPGATIGDDCVIHSNTSIRERVAIGNRVILQNGASIGSDGFGFARRPDGTHEKIPQIGTVVIEDDVEIGANSAIDRPAVGETRIARGAKVDNLVQIAHGVRVGERTLLAAQVGVAGSTTIEEEVVLAGQVGVAGHLTIGKGVVATAQTGIPNSVDPGTMVSGYPAIPNREWLKAAAIYRRLPDLKKAVADLERRLDELERKLADATAGRTAKGS